MAKKSRKTTTSRKVARKKREEISTDAESGANGQSTTSTVKQGDGDGCESPDQTRDCDDPGDDTARRYRYQHAYGVILLVGAASGKLKYHEIWCEHHDDFLGAVNGSFDSYQIKTAKPENGPWNLKRPGFVDAIKKFCTLDERFGKSIESFKFVSNAAVLDSKAKDKQQGSPLQLMMAVKRCTDVSKLADTFTKSFSRLATDCGKSEDTLFSVFQRIEFLKGPSLDDFEAVITSLHLTKLDACKGLPHSTLIAIRDELIQLVCNASSRTVEDPAKHWSCVNSPAISDPWIMAKRVSKSVVDETVAESRGVVFRFSPIGELASQRQRTGQLSVLERKFLAGELRDQILTMRRRTVSAEQHLLELAARDIDDASKIENQLECVVQGVCDDAKLNASYDGGVSGQDMLREVLLRLRKTTEDDPQMVYDQSYEFLVGFAGLLTESCCVWWSDEFDLGDVT